MWDEFLTPAYDNKIYQKYSKSTIKNKVQNKLFLQKELWLPSNNKIPIVCITCELTDKNWASLIKETLDWILALDLQLLVLGVGSADYQETFAEYAEQYPNKMHILINDEISKRKIYAASNISLIFKNNSQNALELKNALTYGVIPVIKTDPILRDYNPITESGNAFLFEKEDKWLFYAAFIRALENYKFKYDWQNLELTAMETLEL